MLSIVMSGLNAAQKDLSVTANNLANAGTTGFKRSDASFMDVYSSDPSANPSTEIGGGTTLADISRSTAQGPLKTTGNVTDLAITGRGFFTLARDSGSAVVGADQLIYTRAGNFSVNTAGIIVDSQGNRLQAFQLDQTVDPTTNLASGKPLISSPTTDIVIPTEKGPGKSVVTLNDTVPVGAEVTVSFSGGSIPPRQVTAAEHLAGVMTFESPDLNFQDASTLSASSSANGGVTLGVEYQNIFTQGISIDTKGLINVNYSDGTNSAIGALAIANFPFEPGLRPVGDTNFVPTVDSGAPVMGQGGAPAAGDIRSGMLEESNVDMTEELTQMLKAQQIYNGNARMMQTSVDLVSRIVDKI